MFYATGEGAFGPHLKVPDPESDIYIKETEWREKGVPQNGRIGRNEGMSNDFL